MNNLKEKTCKKSATSVRPIYIFSDILQNAAFRSQIFLNFLRLRRQGGIDPPNQNPADALESEEKKR